MTAVRRRSGWRCDLARCEKTAFPGYMLFRLYPLSMAHPKPFLKALTGDTLAEDYDGKWHILRNEKEL